MAAWIATKKSTAMGLDMPHLVWKFYEKSCFSFLDMARKRKKWTKNNNNNNKKELDQNQESSPLLRWSLNTFVEYSERSVLYSHCIMKFSREIAYGKLEASLRLSLHLHQSEQSAGGRWTEAIWSLGKNAFVWKDDILISISDRWGSKRKGIESLTCWFFVFFFWLYNEHMISKVWTFLKIKYTQNTKS